MTGPAGHRLSIACVTFILLCSTSIQELLAETLFLLVALYEEFQKRR